MNEFLKWVIVYLGTLLTAAAFVVPALLYIKNDWGFVSCCLGGLFAAIFVLYVLCSELGLRTGGTKHV